MESIRQKFWNYLPEFVYGSIDGTVTTFAIIAGIAGAQLDSGIVLILGFSNVLADGFSMASSNYLSEESHKDQNQNIGSIDTHGTPWKMALATFVSFVVVGSIPLIAYVVEHFYPDLIQNVFYTASVLTLITFFFIGLIRGRVAHASSFKTALQTCLIGIFAALVAYLVGAALKNIV
jgi:VIT1/CCC1 family predicted Fe2+/Mn2+ transporter